MSWSLWEERNGTKRVERGRTSVVGGVRVDVVHEAKRQGCACTRGDRPLGIRAQQGTGAKRAGGWCVVDRGTAHRDLGQVAISTLRPAHGQPRKPLRHAGVVKERDLDILPAERLGTNDDPRR